MLPCGLRNFVIAPHESGIGPSRQAAFFGPTVAFGALRTWPNLQLPGPVANDTRQRSKGLAPAQGQRDHHVVTAAGLSS
jgi:hypothetical protein